MAEPGKVPPEYGRERVRRPRAAASPGSGAEATAGEPAARRSAPQGRATRPRPAREAEPVEPEPAEEDSERSLGRTLSAVGGAFVGMLYLLNPTLGVIELIPDNLPVIGNLDEAGATMLVYYALRYLLRRGSGGGPWPPK